MVLIGITSFHDIEVGNFLGILIDLDGTLYDYAPCHQHALTAAFEHSGLGMTREQFFAAYRQARDVVTSRLDGQGACRSRLFAFQLMAEKSGLPRPYTYAQDLDRLYWTAFVNEMMPFAPAMEFLQRCNLQGLPVCVVSDMTAHVQIEKLTKLAVLDYVDHLVTSEEVGAEKPNPIMFTTALSKIGISADKAVMIGDDQRKDFDGARACGITPLLVTADAQHTAGIDDFR